MESWGRNRSGVEVRMPGWIEELDSLIDAELKLNEPMALHTSFKIGGPADVFVQIENMNALKALISFCQSHEIPLLFVGRGTNLLFSDRGRKGVVAKLAGDFTEISFLPVTGASRDTVSIVVGAGVTLSRLARITAQEGLAGLEFAFGIPGSVGGALLMNAGADSSSMSQLVDSVGVIEKTEGSIHLSLKKKDELEFGYRSSSLGDFVCITRALLSMPQEDPEQVGNRMRKLLRRKKASQPISEASAGCVFKNPPGLSAGKLIDECGLKGERIGGAQVSTLHANFIINTGTARAVDIINLMQKIRSVVRDRMDIELETELKIVEYDDKEQD